MGMDVHGLNPKQSKQIVDFPTYAELSKMGFKDRWEKLDSDDNLKDKYWLEQEQFEIANPGIYFRNNVWWWRPLWNYCYLVADDIISEELFNSGEYNNGAGLNDKDAKLLGNRLMECIADGSTIKYQAEFIQNQDDLPDGDFNKNYPFDVDNVERFALFCIESGGFEIC